MASSPHTTRPARAAPDVMVGDLHIHDATSDLRHHARILALATVGLIHCPDEVQGRQRGPYNVDDDWTGDVESLALKVAYDLERILGAMDAEGKS